MDDPRLVGIDARRARFIQFLAILAGIVVAGFMFPPSVGWPAILVLMALYIALAGKTICGYWCGCLIDGRNKISLSRLQMIAWTILVLSGFVTAAFFNLTSDARFHSLDIAIPEQLWLAMGISTTTLIGSPLVLGTKRGKARKADPEQATETQLTLAELDPERGELVHDGFVVENESPADARWADIFRGEETGNGAKLDLGKIQMFFFSFVLLITYGAQLLALFRSGEAVHEFPRLSDGMITLLGISHTGYLANKAVPHSREEEPKAPVTRKKTTKKKAAKKKTTKKRVSKKTET